MAHCRLICLCPAGGVPPKRTRDPQSFWTCTWGPRSTKEVLGAEHEECWRCTPNAMLVKLCAITLRDAVQPHSIRTSCRSRATPSLQRATLLPDRKHFWFPCRALPAIACMIQSTWQGTLANMSATIRLAQRGSLGGDMGIEHNTRLLLLNAVNDLRARASHKARDPYFSPISSFHFREIWLRFKQGSGNCTVKLLTSRREVSWGKLCIISRAYQESVKIVR